jgi:hypothetical protein
VVLPVVGIVMNRILFLLGDLETALRSVKTEPMPEVAVISLPEPIYLAMKSEIENQIGRPMIRDAHGAAHIGGIVIKAL